MFIGVNSTESWPPGGPLLAPRHSHRSRAGEETGAGKRDVAPLSGPTSPSEGETQENFLRGPELAGGSTS